MTVPLITPLPGNSVRDWTIQNRLNCDRLDSFTGGVAAVPYVPEFSIHSGESFDLDESTLEGFWLRILNMVWAWGRITFTGSSLSLPTGSSDYFVISLPVAAHPEYIQTITSARGVTLGSAHYRDNSSLGNSGTGGLQLRSPDNFVLTTERSADSRLFRHNSPITWAAGDVINFFAKYRGNF